MTMDRTREFQGLLKLFGVTDLPVEVRLGVQRDTQGGA